MSQDKKTIAIENINSLILDCQGQISSLYNKGDVKWDCGKVDNWQHMVARLYEVEKFVRSVDNLKIVKCVRRYKITVKQIADDDLLDQDDREENPAGDYFRFAENEEEALDEFHLDIPISCLDDFDISVEMVEHG